MIAQLSSATCIFTSLQLATVLIGSILLCLFCLSCMPMLKGHIPATRHSVIATSMMAHLLLLSGFLLLPKFEYEILPANWTTAENSTIDQLDSIDNFPIAREEVDDSGLQQSIAIEPTLQNPFRPDHSGAYSPSAITTNEEFTGDSQSDPQNSAAPSLLEQAKQFASSNILLLIWTLGFSACFVWLCFAHLRIRRMVSELAQADSKKEIPSLNAVLDILGIGKKPTVLMWNDNRIPMQIGIFRPTIVLPKSFDAWSDSKQRNVLMHELTHVVRRDGFHGLTSWIAASIFWFNPLIWLLKHLLEQERELACDQSVVAHSDVPTEYAADLVSVVREASAFAPPTAIAMARTSELKRRVENIIGFDPQILKRRKTFAWILCVALMLSALLGSSIALSQVNLQDEEPEVELVAPFDFEAKLSPDLKKTYQSTLKGMVAKNGQRIVAKITAKGVVVDSDGNPVAGADVYLRENWHHRMIESVGFNHNLHAAFQKAVSSTCLAKTKTASDGSFVFSEIETPEFFKDAVHLRDSSLRWNVYVVGDKEQECSVAWHQFSNFEPKPISITLPKPGRIRAQVLGIDGKPVSNARVTLLRLNRNDHGDAETDRQSMTAEARTLRNRQFYSLGNSKLSARAETDADGVFEMNGWPIDHTAFVRIDHPEFLAHDSKAIPIVDRDAELTRIELDPGWQVSIAAVTPTGEPIPNLKFNLWGSFEQDIPFWSIPSIKFKLDDKGEYTSSAIPKCDLTARLARSKDVFSTETSEWIMRPQKIERVDPGDTKEVKLELSKGRVLHGSVVKHEEDDPINADDFRDLSAMFFVVDPAKPYNGEQYATNVDANGKFALRIPDGVSGQVSLARRDGTFVFDLPTISENSSFSSRIAQRNQEAQRLKKLGAYKRQWETNPLEKMTSRKNVAVEETFTLESPIVLWIQRSLSVKGTLRDEDSFPVAFAKFEMVEQGIPHDPNGMSIEFPPLPMTDKDGRFVLTGLQRRYRPIYRIKHPMKELSTDFGWNDFTDYGGQGVELKFQRGVDVRAIVTVDGKPLADQDVYLRMVLGGSSISRKAQTNVSGVCFFKDVPRTPRASIYITRTEQDHIDKSFSTLGEQNEIIVDELNFITVGSGLVEGTVVDPAGNSVANADVSVIQFKTNPHYDYGKTYESVKSDDEGRFKATKVPPDTKLIIRVSPELPKEARFPRDSTPTTVTAMSGQKNIRIILDPRLSRELPWRTKR